MTLSQFKGLLETMLDSCINLMKTQITLCGYTFSFYTIFYITTLLLVVILLLTKILRVGD